MDRRLLQFLNEEDRRHLRLASLYRQIGQGHPKANALQGVHQRTSERGACHPDWTPV